VRRIDPRIGRSRSPLDPTRGAAEKLLRYVGQFCRSPRWSWAPTADGKSRCSAC